MRWSMALMLQAYWKMNSPFVIWFGECNIAAWSVCGTTWYHCCGYWYRVRKEKCPAKTLATISPRTVTDEHEVDAWVMKLNQKHEAPISEPQWVVKNDQQLISVL